MESALDPLDLVKHSERVEKLHTSTIDTEALAQSLEQIVQQAADLINADFKEEFLYMNPYSWHSRKPHHYKEMLTPKKHPITNFSDSSSSTFAHASFSTSSEDSEAEDEHWPSIMDFEFHTIVRQINEFIQTWQLSPATKFVIIGLEKTENKPPFGKRYFIEAHFSKPTPKCPNPLAVAKVYFQVSVSCLLPSFYPVNVTYRFEGCKSKFFAAGNRKISSNKFQRFYIDSILHIKLAFYAKLCECRNPLKASAQDSHNDRPAKTDNK